MLLRKSDEAEARTLAWIGLAFVIFILSATLIAVVNPLGNRGAKEISIIVDTPYVGQGVAVGTGVIMHGVEVGEVTSVSSLAGGGVRVRAKLRAKLVVGLTDTVEIDFRPANYFGVTAINLLPGAGGHALRDGSQIHTVPRGNFALQALLSRLGDLTAGVVTPQLVDVIEKSTRYIDGLDPLLETMLIVADTLTNVQTVSTERLLRNTAGISVAFPQFVAGMIDLGNKFLQTGHVFLPDGSRVTEEFFQTRYLPTLDIASTSLFAAIGRLESTHVDDLLPAVDMVKQITDVVPGLVRPPDIGGTLVELRTRFEKLYGGTPEQRALQVRILLDPLPGVAAPVSVMGGP